MATEILMPRQGNTVESCVILEWRKHEGDEVGAGEVICEVETDKATFEIESPDAGVLLKILHGEGDDVPVLSPIAYVGKAGEAVPEGPSGPEPKEQKVETAGGSPVDSSPVEEPRSAVPAAPTATAATAATAAPEKGPSGKLRISPRARRFATERKVDPAGIAGTGPMGRILERDVRAAMQAGRDAAQEPAPRSVPSVKTVSEGTVTEIPVKGVRKIVAERMLASLTTTAQLTLNSSADARAVLAYRKRLKGSREELGLSGVTINDIVHFALLKTLSRYPALNRHFMGDRILQFQRVHLGFAVDTDRGLMVPVIRNADSLSLKELASEAKRLAAACQGGSVNPDDLAGATFTVTNLGALGIESFTPVLNPPQVAILGVCAVVPKAVMSGEETVFVPSIGLSLTIDHQAVDGAPAARFLSALGSAIADFELTLAE